ncbi:AMP-binding protein [Marinospirillum perlucidum]|uniref:AMP-binding protein n=1 Tax=Marinospirillum perlucidum TaxID=1982602 RepID=UPI000DF2432C|nr:AMP-binding protein [Marinospirillum perlucidum]
MRPSPQPNYTAGFADKIFQHGEKIALIFGDEKISYAQLDDRIQNRKSTWEQLGLVSNHLAAIHITPHPDAIISYLAALQAGIPLLVLDPGIPDETQLSLIEQLGAGWLLRADQSPKKMKVASTSCRDDLALLLSTSGSSGSPKSVMLSYQNIYSNAESIAEYLQIQSTDVAITSLPLHYCYGLSVVNSQLQTGAAIVLTEEPLMSKNFWNEVKAHEVTSLSGVPFHYQMLKRLRLESMDLPSIRYLTQAGGRLPDDDILRFEELCQDKGWSFYVMYGQTEASPRIAYLPPEALPQAVGCIGKAIPGGRLIIRDLETRSVINTVEETGELCYLGPNVMLGYAQKPADLQSNTFLNELATGDLAEWTVEGWVRITGRSSRLLKIQGKRWQLDQLEFRLKKIFSDLLAVTGRDDQLVVVLAADEQQEAMHTYLHRELSIHPTLFRILIHQELPCLSTGKPNYQLLIEEAEKR